jgi:hypothetical protein
MTNSPTTVANYERVLRLRSTTRAEAIAAYQSALADYEAKKQEAIAQIRAKLKNPRWHPFSWIALGIGPPPTHPTAGIRITSNADRSTANG